MSWILKKCNYCNKEYLTCGYNRKRNKIVSKYCSKSCQGKVGGKRAAITNKKNKTGAFHDPKIQSKAGKIGVRTLERKKLGAWYNPKIHANVIQKSIQRQKKFKLSWYNSDVQRKNGIKGGAATIKLLRNKKRIKFNNIYFDSYFECEIGMCIHYQIEKIKEGKNYQFKVNSKWIDFLVNKYKCFVEVHPWDNKRTHSEYYYWRRNILDLNGYRDYKLLVIK
jgi:hypothetical protein